MKTAQIAAHADRLLRDMNSSATTTSVSPTNTTGSSPVIRIYSTSPALGLAYEYFITGFAGSVRAKATGLGWVIENVMEADESRCASPTFDTAGDIQWFRQPLELGMGDIASLFGVTRKAVYDWLDGTLTQKAAFIRAARSLIEQRLPPSSLPYLRQFWDSDLDGGATLLQIFKSGDPSRLASEAAQALDKLAPSIAAYVQQAQSDTSRVTVQHAHNHDEYRNL